MTPTVAFVNNKGGIGRTSLVYHLAWIYAQQGTRVLVCDFDPQAHLTAMLLGEEQLEPLWDPSRPGLAESLRDRIERRDSPRSPHVELVARNLSALVGTPRLAALDGALAEAWTAAQTDPSACRAVTALSDVAQAAAAQAGAHVILIDAGPGLGAINRSALVAADHVVVPLAADLFSVAGIEGLGAWLRDTRAGWTRRRAGSRVGPIGAMRAAGYVVTMYDAQGDPGTSQARWLRRLPAAYAREVLGAAAAGDDPSTDPHCLGIVRNFRGLMFLAEQARKPVFLLRAADGALGSHAIAAQQAFADFQVLADRLAAATWRPAADA